MLFDEVTWDARSWLSRFTEASRMVDSEVLRELRASVFLDTAGIVRQRGYAIDSVQVGLDHDDHYAALHGGTVFYPHTDEQLVPESGRRRFATAVRLEEGDCLEVVRGLVERGGRPAVLNMASRRNPGGGVLGGAGAQDHSDQFNRSVQEYSLNYA